MQIEQLQPVGLGQLETARDAMNAAYNAIALDQTVDALRTNTPLAVTYMHEARAAVAPANGHDALDVAAKAARDVLPRLEHALQLLDVLGVDHDPVHVTPLLDEIGGAMDRIEQALAGAGWE